MFPIAKTNHNVPQVKKNSSFWLFEKLNSLEKDLIAKPADDSFMIMVLICAVYVDKVVLKTQLYECCYQDKICSIPFIYSFDKVHLNQIKI